MVQRRGGLLVISFNSLGWEFLILKGHARSRSTGVPGKKLKNQPAVETWERARDPEAGIGDVHFQFLKKKAAIQTQLLLLLGFQDKYSSLCSECIFIDILAAC